MRKFLDGTPWLDCQMNDYRETWTRKRLGSLENLQNHIRESRSVNQKGH